MTYVLRGDDLSNEIDGGWWIGLGGLAIAALSFAGGAFSRRLNWAVEDTKTSAETRGRLTLIEAQLRAIETQTAAVEFRANARMTAIELGKDRIDVRLAEVVTREEFREGNARIERQIELLSQYIHDRELPRPTTRHTI